MYSTTQPIVLQPSGTTTYSAYRQPIKPLSPRRQPGQPYFDTDKIRAMAVYAETGNQAEAARQSGVIVDSVNDWVNSEQHTSLIGELRATIRYNEGWRLSRLFSKSLDVVEERLAKGDAVVLKTGETIYKPVSYRDAVVGASILFDKWMCISGAISNEAALMGQMHELSSQLSSLGTGLVAASPPSSSPQGPLSPGGSGENLIG